MGLERSALESYLALVGRSASTAKPSGARDVAVVNQIPLNELEIEMGTRGSPYDKKDKEPVHYDTRTPATSVKQGTQLTELDKPGENDGLSDEMPSS